jgi:hypothetical protein
MRSKKYDENIQKEEFSIAYLRAVCAKAKVAFTLNPRDDDGVDVFLKKTITIDGVDYDSTIEAQLKSTTLKSVTENDTTYIYKFRAKNYNDMLRKSCGLRLLMLLVLPTDDSEWFSQDMDRLILKKCMYYKSFENEQTTNNTDSISISIDKSNICTPENIEKMMIEYVEDLYDLHN